MCVILVCEKQKPNFKTIKACYNSNKDGMGIAFLRKGQVHWAKGIEKPEDINNLVELVKPPFVLHFRISTVGGNSKLLTHPFPIMNSAKLALWGRTKSGVLFHNGHWSDWEERLFDIVMRGYKLPKGEWSDSRAIAWLTAKFGEQMLSLIPAQKIAILSPSGVKTYGVGWIKKDGILYSNLNHEYTYVGYNTDDGYDWKGYTHGVRRWNMAEKAWEDTKEEQGELIKDSTPAVVKKGV